MTRSRNSNGLGALVAVLFVGLGTMLFGIFKTISHLIARQRGYEKASALAREGFEKGLTEEQIVKAFFDDARKQLRRPLTESDKEKIRNIVRKERTRPQA